jgi:hypothetical protein
MNQKEGGHDGAHPQDYHLEGRAADLHFWSVHHLLLGNGHLQLGRSLARAARRLVQRSGRLPASGVDANDEGAEA